MQSGFGVPWQARRQLSGSLAGGNDSSLKRTGVAKGAG
jgi:hypothetical protein